MATYSEKVSLNEATTVQSWIGKGYGMVNGEFMVLMRPRPFSRGLHDAERRSETLPCVLMRPRPFSRGLSTYARR